MARPGLEPEVLRTVGVSGGPCPGALEPKLWAPLGRGLVNAALQGSWGDVQTAWGGPGTSGAGG